MQVKIVCTENQHAEPAFKCFNDFCMNKICSKCAHAPDVNNNILCKLCMISAVNIGENGMAFASDSEEEEKFDGTGLQQNAHVYFDQHSSQVLGWQSIWAIIEGEEEDKKNLERKLQDGIQAYITDRNSNQLPSP